MQIKLKASQCYNKYITNIKKTLFLRLNFFGALTNKFDDQFSAVYINNVVHHSTHSEKIIEKAIKLLILMYYKVIQISKKKSETILN